MDINRCVTIPVLHTDIRMDKSRRWWCERNTTRGQVMKFVMIILFATAGDIYMFTDPTFDSKNECMISNE